MLAIVALVWFTFYRTKLACATTSGRVERGDVVIPRAAVRMEGALLHYAPIEFPAAPGFDILAAPQ